MSNRRESCNRSYRAQGNVGPESEVSAFVIGFLNYHSHVSISISSHDGLIATESMISINFETKTVYNIWRRLIFVNLVRRERVFFFLQGMVLSMYIFGPVSTLVHIMWCGRQLELSREFGLDWRGNSQVSSWRSGLLLDWFQLSDVIWLQSGKSIPVNSLDLLAISYNYGLSMNDVRTGALCDLELPLTMGCPTWLFPGNLAPGILQEVESSVELGTHLILSLCLSSAICVICLFSRPRLK